MTAKAKASRLDEIRQRFQTRPLHEKEQKLVAMYQRQQQQALEKMAKTFRRQGSDLIAKKSSLDEAEARAPRQRAVIGGRHNVLEPLRKENESNLPRPSRPNDRYAPTPPTRPGLARPHLFLAKHGGKLPAVGRRSNSVSHLQVATPTHDGGDSVAVALARKEREIRLQLKKRETDLEIIRKELLDSDLVRERRETTNNSEGGEMIADLLPCSVCGRKFVADRLEKHVEICSKTSRKKRKVFSSAIMRRRGTEMEQYSRRKGEENRGVSRKPGKGNWRRQHGERPKKTKYRKFPHSISLF